MRKVIRIKSQKRQRTEIDRDHGTQSSELIDLFNVEKRYDSGNKIGNNGDEDQFTALRGVSLTLSLNTITVIVGPSGSGKTTLLSLIGCMSRPTSGRIRLGGKEITSLPERFLAGIRRERFGFIFQNYNLIQGITVLENTMLPAVPTDRKPERVKTKALELLEKLKIASKAHLKVKYLSGGEQQRVAIARALINDPEIIIADEPTAHLNTHLALEFIDIIAELQAEGRTILIASHDPLLYKSDSVNRVLVMRDGQIVKFASKNDLTASNKLFPVDSLTAKQAEANRDHDGDRRTGYDRRALYDRRSGCDRR
jgi:putative ABC transport system ATP-binding protein